MPAPRKLPVWSTVRACYAIVARNLGQLVRISWLWLLIMVPVYATLHWLDWRWRMEGSIAGPVALVLVELPFLASIAVAWHRLVLRHERVAAPAYLRLDSTVWLYVLYPLLLMLLVLAWSLPPLLLPTLEINPGLDLSLAAGLVPALVIVLLVLPRLSLVLPALALGARLSPARAWRMSRGNTLRLALATVLCILPAVLPVLPAVWWEWTAGTEDRVAYVVGELINSVGYAVLIIFAVTLLSLTYRFFAAPGDESASPSA
jgi:hypothetical protein